MRPLPISTFFHGNGGVAIGRNNFIPGIGKDDSLFFFLEGQFEDVAGGDLSDEIPASIRHDHGTGVEADGALVDFAFPSLNGSVARHESGSGAKPNDAGFKFHSRTLNNAMTQHTLKK